MSAAPARAPRPWPRPSGADQSEGRGGAVQLRHWPSPAPVRPPEANGPARPRSRLRRAPSTSMATPKQAGRGLLEQTPGGWACGRGSRTGGGGRAGSRGTRDGHGGLGRARAQVEGRRGARNRHWGPGGSRSLAEGAGDASQEALGQRRGPGADRGAAAEGRRPAPSGPGSGGHAGPGLG